ncbi:MAG: UDP-N-acetylmuramoyl-L-alanine--D-glutamate ligase [Eubacteriales bacterium]
MVDTLFKKRILIWGLGVEGKATRDFIQSYCEPSSVETFEGKAEDISWETYDYVVKSPGIYYPEPREQIISQTSLFLGEFRDQVIGITGTKGKSTTASLLYHTLRSCGKDVILVGNIGLPPLERYHEITEETIIVFELSCHQLYQLQISPHVAVYLNLYEDHLDYYGTIEHYHGAKLSIIRYQEKSDICYQGENVPDIPTQSRKEVIHKADAKGMNLTSLQGEHNQYNAYVVMEIATKLYGIAKEAAMEAMNSFRGLPHRLERLGEIEGVTYYDDSISTICQSAIQATTSIHNVGTVLIGGMDRGIDYGDLIDFIKERSDVNFICMYASGNRIYQEVCHVPDAYYCEDLDEAIPLAQKITPWGKACILSPAAASYGYFKNFEERGDYYKQKLGF